MNAASDAVVGVILVGYGYASATFHAPLIQVTDGLQLQAIVSSDPTKVHAHWPRLPVYASLEEALGECSAPLVVVATPNDTHYPLAAQALTAGRHVVVDKPFTLTLAQADELIAQAHAAQRVLSVFHNRRWDGDFLQLRRLLAEGTLGRWTHVESHFDRFRPRVRQRWREAEVPGAGLWYDLGPHLLDQVLCLFGTPESIWLDTACQRDGAVVDDWFHAVLTYGSMRVLLHASALSARAAPRWVVHGTQGSFEKWGFDPQEEALKAVMASDATTRLESLRHSSWGQDPRPGTLFMGDASELQMLPAIPGDYRQYYAGLRTALLYPDKCSVPVPATEAREVMRWLELGLRSRKQRRAMDHAATLL